MRTFLAFFLGAWAGWIIGAAITVFVLGQLVRPMTASASFTMLAWYTIIPSVVVGVAASLGARGRSPPLRFLRVPALVMGLLSMMLMLAGEALERAPLALAIVAFWVLLPAVAAYWSNRLARRAVATLQSPASDQPAYKG